MDQSNTKKRIVVIAPNVEVKGYGAAEKDILESVAAFAAMGYAVDFWTLAPNAQKEMLVARGEPKSNGVWYSYKAPKTSFWEWLHMCLYFPALLDRSGLGFWHLARTPKFLAYLEREKPDAVFSFISSSWPVLRVADKRGIRTILRSHNFEPSFYFELIEWYEKWYPSNWVRYLGKYLSERNAVFASDAVGTLPFEQVELYRKWNPDHVHILPLIFVGMNLTPPRVHAGKKPLDVFFLGSNYRVAFHRRGVDDLITRIAPEVERRAPLMFRFHICGSWLPKNLQEQCDGTHIIYENYVRDFEQFMAGMDIGAFPTPTKKPMMKGKVFESLCRAFPTIIPDSCRGGAPLRDREEIMLADGVEATVEAILALRDDNLRLKLSEGAYRFSKEHLSPHAIQEILGTLVEGE